MRAGGLCPVRASFRVQRLLALHQNPGPRRDGGEGQPAVHGRPQPQGLVVPLARLAGRVAGDAVGHSHLHSQQVHEGTG